MVKVTFEFPNIDAAIVALGKMVATPVKVTQSVAAQVGTDKADASAPAPATTARQGRSDKGVPRKKRSDAGTSVAAVVLPDNGGAVQTAAAPDADVASAPEVIPVASAAQAAAAPVATPTAPVQTPTEADAQAALKALFEAPGKGMPAAQEALQRFGVNRLSGLKADQRADFVAYVNEQLAAK